MRDAAVRVDEQIRRAAAHVDDRDANFLLVVREHRVRARQGLEHDVRDLEATPLDAANDVLDAGARRRDQVHPDLEAHAAHPDGVTNTVLVVDQVLARQRVQDHPIGVDRDRASAF